MANNRSTPSNRHPLNCPKGYGLCYGCAVWCDVPSEWEQRARAAETPEELERIRRMYATRLRVL